MGLWGSGLESVSHHPHTCEPAQTLSLGPQRSQELTPLEAPHRAH